MKRIPSLDGLRAIAIALVLANHIFGLSDSGVSGELWFLIGRAGVQLFFVISGFLITTLLAEERTATGSIRLGYFYIRRALRIMPAFWVYVWITMLTCHAPIGDIGASLFYVTDYIRPSTTALAHTWSLSIEEQFYLIWPITMRFLKNPGRALIWVVVFSPLVRLLLCMQGAIGHFGPRLRFEWNMDALAIGCLMALHREKLRRLVVRGSAVSAVAGVASLIVFQCFCSELIGCVFGTSIITILLGALILELVEIAPNWINSTPFALVGLISYSLYLYQQILWSATNLRWWQWLPLAMVAAWASHRLVEKPFLNLRDRLCPHQKT